MKRCIIALLTAVSLIFLMLPVMACAEEDLAKEKNIDSAEVEPLFYTFLTSEYHTEYTLVGQDGNEISLEETKNPDREYSVSVSVSGNGSVDGGGKYHYGEYCQLAVNAESTGRFVGWYEGSTLLSTAKEYRFAVKKDMAVTAVFADANKIPMYRLYNPYTQEHLLSSNPDEKDALLGIGWTLDGVAWFAPDSGIPVYRLYNPFDDWHIYSMSQAEIDTLTPLGWTVDGAVTFSAEGGGRPIFRLFNPYVQTNYHMLTASEEERDFLAGLGWIYEGVAWNAAN